MKEVAVAGAGAGARFTTYDAYTPDFPRVLLTFFIIAFILFCVYLTYKSTK